jgi:hypothetical protein
LTSDLKGRPCLRSPRKPWPENKGAVSSSVGHATPCPNGCSVSMSPHMPTASVGIPIRRSRTRLRVPSSPDLRTVVTRCDRLMRFTFGLPLNRWDSQLAQGSGSQPGPEVPDDHCRPIHCPRHDPARLHRRRTARARRVPGRLPRPDPRGVGAGPAPVHQLVPPSVPASVRRPPRRHRKLRPGAGSPGPCARHRHPAAVHNRRVLQVAVEEELLEHSPAAHVRRPRVDYESHAVALDRNELGAMLVAAGLGPPVEHALIPCSH